MRDLPARDRGYGRDVEEARAVLRRLDRIADLERAGAEPAMLVAELRALLVEATAWSRGEGGADGERAVEDLRSALRKVGEG
jgi:hypothetical protein